MKIMKAMRSKKKGSKAGKAVKSEEPRVDPEVAARKALLSRKSCAYKKARGLALKAGKTPEEATVLAKEAARLIELHVHGASMSFVSG